MYRLPLLFLSVASIASVGCTTMTPSIGDIFAVSSNEQVTQEFENPTAAPTPDIPSFVVEMRGSSKESQKFKRPLLDDSTYVQTVLTQSRALKHFGRIKIELWRPRPDGHGYHKIDIPYDRKARSVPPAYDYSMREGDRLIFMEDDSSILDDMLGAIGG